MIVNWVSWSTDALMWFPSVSLWLSLDRCPLVPLVNYGCGAGGGLIPVLMCTDRQAHEEVNKPFHPSSGYMLRNRTPPCALIIHSNRTVSQNRRQAIHSSRPRSISMCGNSINTNSSPSLTSEILRKWKLFLHISEGNIPHIKRCQILSLEKK